MAREQSAQLKRTISTLGQIGIALATISPVAGVFANIQGSLGTGGTGMLWAYVIAAVITFGIAFTYSEMGSIYPVSGGVYSIIRNVLGPSVGFMALTDYLIQAVVMPATIALGSAQYFQALMPSVSLNVIGFVVMLIVTLIALASTSLEAKFTGFFVVLEIILMTVLTIMSIVHIHQPLSIYTHPVVLLANKHVVTSTWSMVIAATAIALFSYNGYDNALNVSEETKGSSKQIGTSVVKAAGLAIVFQLIPIFFMLLATPSIPGLLNSNDPLAMLGLSLFGPNASVVFDVAAGFAILNSTLGVTIQFSRILYASGRDGVWPSGMNRLFTKIAKTGSPYAAVLVIGVIGLIMSFFSTFLFDLTFIGVILVVLYLLVTIAALVSKIRDRRIERPYKAPLGFFFPVLGFVGAFIVLTQQSASSLITTAILFAIGLLYWLLIGRRMKATSDVTGTHNRQISQ